MAFSKLHKTNIKIQLIYIKGRRKLSLNYKIITYLMFI